jgi:hypothetical protein
MFCAPWDAKLKSAPPAVFTSIATCANHFCKRKLSLKISPVLALVLRMPHLENNPASTRKTQTASDSCAVHYHLLADAIICRPKGGFHFARNLCDSDDTWPPQAGKPM